VRHAQQLGLICVVSRAVANRAPLPADGVVLEISGPFALFRKTDVYGRSLSSLLPRAARCQHFELEADCVLARGAAVTTLHISPIDPIYPEREAPSYARRVEARFARDFEALATAWQLVREPEPLDADGSLIFPDFELVHREHPEQRWQLELVGFWTPQHLREKLGRLRAAKLERLILCVDDTRRCSESDLPPEAHVLRYKGRVDAAAILAIIEAAENRANREP